MRTFRLVMIAAALACDTSVMAGDIAPGGTLRAIYLGSNPAQAMRDPATGEVRGPRVVKKLKRAKDLGQRAAVDFWAAIS